MKLLIIDLTSTVSYIKLMYKKFLNSITGKLILDIGSMMLIVGWFFAFAFIKHNPNIEIEVVLFYGGLFVIAISFLLCLILHFIVAKPISLLTYGMDRLSKGDVEYRINLHTKDETGLLADSLSGKTFYA